MIRPSSLIALGVAVGLGLGLSQLKNETRLLESELTALNRAILKEQEALHVLSAEWAYLTDPARLQRLGARHLALSPMTEARIVTVSDIPHGTPIAPSTNPANP